MSASLNQADLPARELMCVNDASVCKCLTQITMIPGLILAYWASFLSLQQSCFIGCQCLFPHQCFSLEKCQVCVASVWLCYTGPLSDEVMRCDFICFLCECWDDSNYDFKKRQKIIVWTFMEVLQISIFQQILWQLYHEITNHHRYICATLHVHIDRYRKS